jgi:hypothetical protein
VRQPAGRRRSAARCRAKFNETGHFAGPQRDPRAAVCLTHDLQRHRVEGGGAPVVVGLAAEQIGEDGPQPGVGGVQ